MRTYRNYRLLVACLSVGLLACGVASAQYASGFEAPTFTGSADGTVMTGQDAFYLPSGVTSVDYFVYTYAGNVLEVVDHPVGGGEQFVAGTGPADNGVTFARAQRDITWGTGIVVATYDVLALWTPNEPNDPVVQNNIGSFSVQPYPGSASYLHLFSWVNPTTEDTSWQAFYLMYNAQGTADAQPGREPGPEWTNLTVNTWYRCTTVIDFNVNKVVEVSITDLHTGASATVDVSAEGYYLEGGEAGGMPEPTGFRFFAGGNLESNTLAFDNLEIGPPGEACPGDVDGDGDTDLADLGALLAVYGGYDPACDFDGDGDVDLADLAYLLSDYGCVP